MARIIRVVAWDPELPRRQVSTAITPLVINPAESFPFLSSARRANQLRAEVHADAITAYAYQRDGKNAPYAQLAHETEQFWNECQATGSEVVPIVMTGWDRRPRVEHPVFWEGWQKPMAGIDKFYRPPTPEELSSHLRAAMTWVNTNVVAAPAKTVLIYA